MWASNSLLWDQELYILPIQATSHPKYNYFKGINTIMQEDRVVPSSSAFAKSPWLFFTKRIDTQNLRMIRVSLNSSCRKGEGAEVIREGWRWSMEDVTQAGSVLGRKEFDHQSNLTELISWPESDKSRTLLIVWVHSQFTQGISSVCLSAFGWWTVLFPVDPRHQLTQRF